MGGLNDMISIYNKIGLNYTAKMEKLVKNTSNIIFKKDFFIKTRKEDIRLVY